jgi:hypothetical protein
VQFFLIFNRIMKAPADESQSPRQLGWIIIDIIASKWDLNFALSEYRVLMETLYLNILQPLVVPSWQSTTPPAPVKPMTSDVPNGKIAMVIVNTFLTSSRISLHTDMEAPVQQRRSTAFQQAPTTMFERRMTSFEPTTPTTPSTPKVKEKWGLMKKATKDEAQKKRWGVKMTSMKPLLLLDGSHIAVTYQMGGRELDPCDSLILVKVSEATVSDLSVLGRGIGQFKVLRPVADHTELVFSLVITPGGLQQYGLAIDDAELLATPRFVQARPFSCSTLRSHSPVSLVSVRSSHSICRAASAFLRRKNSSSTWLTRPSHPWLLRLLQLARRRGQ